MATILITDSDNGIVNKQFNYLIGFQPSLGGIVIKKNSLTMFFDDRYFDGIKKLNKNNIINLTKKENIYFKKFKGRLIDEILIECSNSTTLKLEKDLTLRYFEEINNKSDLGIYLSPKKTEIIENYFSKKRKNKSKEEITKIKKAIEIIENTFKGIEKLNKSGDLIGKTEKQIRQIIQENILGFGGNGESFDSIVAFGQNSAIPHHQSGNTKIGNGPLLIDMGAIFEGYCSDFTRVIWIGEKNEQYKEFEKIYNIVKTAHDKAKSIVQAGISAFEIDKEARDYIKKEGYGEYFTHSTGHGVGLNIHESPFINEKSQDIIEKNMVFTIEPGIYLEGKFGIRYENIVIV